MAIYGRTGLSRAGGGRAILTDADDTRNWPWPGKWIAPAEPLEGGRAVAETRFLLAAPPGPGFADAFASAAVLYPVDEGHLAWMSAPTLRLSVNGAIVLDRPAAVFYAADLQPVDLSPYLRAGENHVVLEATGGRPREPFDPPSGELALYLQAMLELPRGSVFWLVTGVQDGLRGARFLKPQPASVWTAGGAPVREIASARCHPRVSLLRRAGSLAEAISNTPSRLSHETVRPTNTLNPLELEAGAELLLDFGREVVGTVRGELEAAGRVTLTVQPGESLPEAHRTDVEPPITVTQPSSGRQPFQHPERQAFRFLQVRNASRGRAVLRDLNVDFAWHDTPHRGSFLCSDDRLNRIYEISRYTVHLCMQDFHEDGVKRDGLLWTGDLRSAALSSYYAIGDSALARKSLLQLAANQLADGAVPGVGPAPTAMVLPDYCALWVIALHDYYLFSGDLETVRLLYPALQRQTDWFHASRDGEGSVGPGERPDWWLFLDWSTNSRPFECPIEKRGQVTALQALYAGALQAAADLAAANADPRGERVYRGRLEAVRANAAAHLWDERAGGFADCNSGGERSGSTEQTNALAEVFGLAEPGELAGWFAAADRPLTTVTPYMQFYVAQAEFRSGRLQAALDLIRGYWGGMVDLGATTFWEAYDPQGRPESALDFYGRKFALSLCHAWSGGPAMLLPAYIAGIRPLDPGWSRAVIQPELGDLEWLNCVVPTPRGLIQLRVDRGQAPQFSVPDGVEVVSAR